MARLPSQANRPRYLRVDDPSTTSLRQVLQGQTIIEYPTLYLVPDELAHEFPIGTDKIEEIRLPSFNEYGKKVNGTTTLCSSQICNHFRLWHVLPYLYYKKSLSYRRNGCVKFLFVPPFQRFGILCCCNRGSSRMPLRDWFAFGGVHVAFSIFSIDCFIHNHDQSTC